MASSSYLKPQDLALPNQEFKGIETEPAAFSLENAKKEDSCYGLADLENTLRQRIDLYRHNTKKGYRRLSTDIEENLRKYLLDKNLTEQQITDLIKQNVPSHSYLCDFYKGRKICLNHLNSLAFFFEVKYIIFNFAIA